MVAGTTIEDLVAQYARYHFGAELEAPMTALLFGLEQNWVGGDVGTNTHILSTLSLAAGVMQHYAQTNTTATYRANWRVQMYLLQSILAYRPTFETFETGFWARRKTHLLGWCFSFCSKRAVSPLKRSSALRVGRLSNLNR